MTTTNQTEAERSIAEFSELKSMLATLIYMGILPRDDIFQNLVVEFLRAVESTSRAESFERAGLTDPEPDRDTFAWLNQMLADNRRWREEIRSEHADQGKPDIVH